MQEKTRIQIILVLNIIFLTLVELVTAVKYPSIMPSCLTPGRIYPENLSTMQVIDDVQMVQDTVVWRERTGNNNSELWFQMNASPQQLQQAQNEVVSFALTSKGVAWMELNTTTSRVKWCILPCTAATTVMQTNDFYDPATAYQIAADEAHIAWLQQIVNADQNTSIFSCTRSRNGHRGGCLSADQKEHIEIRKEETIRIIKTTKEYLYILTKEWSLQQKNQIDRLYIYEYKTKNLRKIYEEKTLFTNSHIKTLGIAAVQNQGKKQDTLILLYNAYNNESSPWELLAFPITGSMLNVTKAERLYQVTPPDMLRDLIVQELPAAEVLYTILIASPQTQQTILHMKASRGWKQYHFAEDLFFHAKSMSKDKIVYTEAREPVNKIMQMQCA